MEKWDDKNLKKSLFQFYFYILFLGGCVENLTLKIIILRGIQCGYSTTLGSPRMLAIILTDVRLWIFEKMISNAVANDNINTHKIQN